MSKFPFFKCNCFVLNFKSFCLSEHFSSCSHKHLGSKVPYLLSNDRNCIFLIIKRRGTRFQLQYNLIPLLFLNIYKDWVVFLIFVSISRLYPSQPLLSPAPFNTSMIVSILASVLSARLRARASINAGFLGDPYSSSP